MIKSSNRDCRVAIRKISFHQRRILPAIGFDLKVIWEMSDKEFAAAAPLAEASGRTIPEIALFPNQLSFRSNTYPRIVLLSCYQKRQGIA